jgi:hypothetical protein
MGNKQGKSSSLSPSHQAAKDQGLSLNPDLSVEDFDGANITMKQEQQNEPTVSSSFGEAEKTPSDDICPQDLPVPPPPPPFRMPPSPVKRSGSQKKLFIDHLQTIPFGPESVNKVSMIRLIHKSKFIAHPIIQDYLRELLDLFDQLRYHRNGYGGYVIGFDLSEAEKEENRPLQKPKMTLGKEIEAERGGISADELYEENKPVKVQTFRKHKLSVEFRKLVENLLFWRDHHHQEDCSTQTPESDQFCEIFPLDNCPDFTFVSHRWATNGRALGKHLELLLFLALSKEDYIWLDCCCSPQDPYSLSHGHTMQVIWNIGAYLSQAKNVSSYYFTDGIDGPRYEKNDDEVGRESGGAVFLYHLLYPSYGTLPQSVRTGIEQRNFENASRLWCVLERRLGGHKMLSSEEYDRNTLFQALNRPQVEIRGTTDLVHQPVLVDEGFVPDRFKNNWDIAEDRINYYHAKHQSSLDCFSDTDIEPVTQLLFQHHAFPFYIKDNWPRCGTVHDNDGLKFGIRLPDPEKNQLYGWYYYHADDPVVQRYMGGRFRNEEKAEKYYFMCDWPFAPHQQCRTIRLQVHVNCLKQQEYKDQKREFLYHPNESPQLAMRVDNEHSGVSCLLCSKEIPIEIGKEKKEKKRLTFRLFS